jgi:hypothetical protein
MTYDSDKYSQIKTTATSPRGRKYTVSIVRFGLLNEVALLDDNDEFVHFDEFGHEGDPVSRFMSFEEMTRLMTAIREKIVELDVGWATALEQSKDLHPAGKLKSVK